jgi:hypothetical protein
VHFLLFEEKIMFKSHSINQKRHKADATGAPDYGTNVLRGVYGITKIALSFLMQKKFSVPKPLCTK